MNAAIQTETTMLWYLVLLLIKLIEVQHDNLPDSIWYLNEINPRYGYFENMPFQLHEIKRVIVIRIIGTEKPLGGR